jgi:membrane associated rhomboid family serine protease
MVLPIGDAPNPRGAVPILTYALIAANVAVYLFVSMPLEYMPPTPGPALEQYLQVMTHALHGRVPVEELLRHLSQYDLFVFTYGFRPAAPSVSALFFSMFLHAGLLHLAGNMLFLWIYGDNVEHRLGAVPYLVAYLGSGVAATLFHAMSASGSPVPMIGASGAISGVLGFYFVFFPRNRVRLLWLFPPFLMQVFEVPARLVLGLYLVIDNLLPYLFATSDVGVAHGAHIGGFVAGLGAAWLWSRRGADIQPPEFPRARPERRPAGETVGELIAAGLMEEAAERYFALSTGATRRLLTPEHSLALAHWLHAHGHHEAALVVLRRHVRDYPRGPGLAEVYVTAGEVLLRDLDQPTSAYQHFLAALDVDPTPEQAAAARRGLAEIEGLQKRRVGRR